MSRLTLQVVVCSTRVGRKGPAVAAWMQKVAEEHGVFNVELVDLADVNLPLFDEPEHPRLGKYVHEHTKRWSAIVSRADAFVFVTPEYNFAPPASLTNALQYLVKEWSFKPAAFLSYGGVSAGTRSAQMSKLVLTTLNMMPVPQAVAIPFFSKSIDAETGEFDPGEVQAKAAAGMLDALERWSSALKHLRS